MPRTRERAPELETDNGRNEWDRMQTTTQMQCNAHDNMTWMNATHAHDKTTKTRKDEEPGMELMKPKIYIAKKGKYYIRGITNSRTGRRKGTRNEGDLLVPT